MADEKVRTEEFQVKGEESVAKIKELIREGNIRRVIIKNEDGRTLIDIPLTIGVVGVLVAPQLAALGAIAAQSAASFLIIFLFSVIFAGVDSTSRLGWLALLFAIWLGYVIGFNLVGYAALRWFRNGIPLLTRQRLIGTVIGAFIPLLILLVIGYSVPVGGAG